MNTGNGQRINVINANYIERIEVGPIAEYECQLVCNNMEAYLAFIRSKPRNFFLSGKVKNCST